VLGLGELSELFAGRGYDAVFMCEHDRGFTTDRKQAYDRACAEASTRGALLIPGIEYADAEDRIHVPVWGPVPFLAEGLATRDVLQAALDHGGAAVIAHPRRRDGWRSIDPSWLRLCAGIEIWTRKWDGWAPNTWAVRQATDAGVLGVVSLDLHHRSQLFPLAMDLELPAALSVASAVEALRRGAARPMIRSFPVARLTHGRLALAAGRVERLRRPVWRRARPIRDRLRLVR
jgi:hypothetical protein